MNTLIKKITNWGREDLQVEAILLVGSFARKQNKIDSDLDVCIITEEKEDMLHTLSFIHTFGEVKRYVLEYWGECTSVRVWYEEGAEVEFGIVKPSWYSLPLDQGTKSVLLDGYEILVDKKNVLSNTNFPVKPFHETMELSEIYNEG
ncbi:nucleotidyltransferase domain-containing protein [Anaerosporobacter faecicola]|uniref:nucleotidyltransferase domain-containing protein n=1 Tax=Anaerosporobacter faecicola TaxID=2718714 RepID=UPI00143C9B98|nr:nucleotidyltransferase domain-containing protein [Anaerosporobacter faecicola]